MSEQTAEYKRQALADRAARRDSESVSILETMGLEPVQDSPELDLHDFREDEITLESKPAKCKTCYGQGTVKGLFFRRECDDCYGTGYALSDPIAIIKWQKLCMAWAKQTIKNQREQLKMATTTEEERLEESIQRAYSGSSYNKHD